MTTGTAINVSSRLRALTTISSRAAGAADAPVSALSAALAVPRSGAQNAAAMIDRLLLIFRSPLSYAATGKAARKFLVIDRPCRLRAAGGPETVRLPYYSKHNTKQAHRKLPYDRGSRP